MKRWAIVYDGGEVRSSDEISWADAPHRGVLVVVLEDDEVGRTLCWGHDFYWWFPGQEGPTGGDVFGLRDYLEELGSPQAKGSMYETDLDVLSTYGIKFGRVVYKDAMREALGRALEVEGFAAKSAYHASEARPEVLS